jgi:hypothetical protein
VPCGACVVTAKDAGIDVTDSVEDADMPLPPRVQIVADVVAEVRARRIRQEAQSGEDRRSSDDGDR